MSILTRGAVDLYALFEWGLTVFVLLTVKVGKKIVAQTMALVCTTNVSMFIIL
ncbi:hypothetical protein B4166_2661 [Caldibacillus thermoamylovorans]|uniref:Uncharacterized protein n=1 Tax=Caldibacillus thermoamylovorans TaxID=35841 RepID=A0ABD4A9G1_9BACI|nr:hypothetical protein B4166_2661 [Caldibacillus thermoamylovorans]KIO73315.1 hypothetical protein B4167_2239 [Caldibacillus thermoamylovorans]